MGVEAARVALRHAPEGAEPGLLAFATTEPAYLDKTNATAIHAALGLPTSVPAFDAIGSVRSGVGALVDGAGALAASRCSPTSARVSRAAATKPTGAMPRWPSCSPRATT